MTDLRDIDSSKKGDEYNKNVTIQKEAENTTNVSMSIQKLVMQFSDQAQSIAMCIFR